MQVNLRECGGEGEMMFVYLFFDVALMRKHHRVILNYYLKYMSGFDAQMLRNVVMVSFLIC